MRLAYKWRVLISVIFGLFMVILDSTVVNVAFPTLRSEFKVSVSDSQWVISIYVMALGISTPLSAYLADRFGIKRTYVTGLAFFVIGSIICGFAPNLGILIATRAVQGFGGGLALPLGTALLFNSFPVAEQGVAFGVFGIALVVAPAMGPILGGALVDHGLWRWIFFINVPIGILGVTLATLWLREQRSDHPPTFDILGFITSAIGFGSVLYAASVASNDGWTSRTVLTFFAIGAVALAAFALIELFVAKQPLLNLRLFQRPVFLAATLVGYVSVLALFGAEFLLPLYLQELRGKSAFETGLILLPLAISSGIIAPFAGRFYDLVGPRVLLVVGFGILAINTWQLSQITATTSIGFLLFLLALRGVALGLTIQTTSVAALGAVSPRETARASSLTNATRQVVQSIGVAVLAAVLTATLSTQTKAFEAQFQNTNVNSSSSIPGVSFANGICGVSVVSAPVLSGPPTPEQVGQIKLAAITKAVHTACTESIQGFQNAYFLTTIFALIAMLLGLFLPGWPAKWAGRATARRPEGDANAPNAPDAAGDAGSDVPSAPVIAQP